MRDAILTSTAVIACFGLVFGASSANASSLPLGGESALFSADETETVRERATSAFDNMMSRFITVDTEERATATNTPEQNASECPEEEETKLAESDEDKEGDKNTPQGPEPIYFAF